MIVGWVWACTGAGVNKVTGDFVTDINNMLTHKKWDIPVKWMLTLCSISGMLTTDANTVMSSA